MNAKSIQQFAIVRGDTATDFEEQLNARIRELSDFHPEVRFDGLTAYISYKITQYTPETQAEANQLKGIDFRCIDCPMFDEIRNENGEIDHRYKYGNCEMAERGRTYKDNAACDYLFELIRSGRVGLCYRK